jgi:hypothetical protein
MIAKAAQLFYQLQIAQRKISQISRNLKLHLPFFYYTASAASALLLF